MSGEMTPRELLDQVPADELAAFVLSRYVLSVDSDGVRVSTAGCGCCAATVYPPAHAVPPTVAEAIRGALKQAALKQQAT